MRVLAWNIGWNSGPQKIEAVAAAVDAMAPDIAFFSEWSPLPTRTIAGGRLRSNACHALGDLLRDGGLAHQSHEHVSNRGGKDAGWRQNYWGILSASRAPIEKVDTVPPLDGAGSWLEVMLESGVSVVGLRQLAWDGHDLPIRRAHWTWMVEQFDRLKDTPSIVIGDFNTEMPAVGGPRRTAFGDDLLWSMTDERGWRDPFDVVGLPKGPTYWKSVNGKRLDYAFLSPALIATTTGIEAVTELDGRRISGPARDALGEPTHRLADHAPLVLDLALD